MVIVYRRIAIKEETYNLLFEDCKKVFLENNKIMKNLNITQDLLIRRLVDYYLGRT